MTHKRVLINQLRIEGMEKIPTNEKRKIILELRNKHAMSYRAIETKTGIAISTQHHWMEGRQDRELYFPLDKLSVYFEDEFKPRLKDFPYLLRIKKILEKILAEHHALE